MVETGAKSDGEVVLSERKFDVFQEDFEISVRRSKYKRVRASVQSAYKAHKKEQSKDVPTAMECGGDSDTEQNAMEVDGEKENEDNGVVGEGATKRNTKNIQEATRLKQPRELQRLSRDGVSVPPPRRTSPRRRLPRAKN